MKQNFFKQGIPCYRPVVDGACGACLLGEAAFGGVNVHPNADDDAALHPFAQNAADLFFAKIHVVDPLDAGV